MKRLAILSTLLLVAASSAGCCHNWCRRGATCQTCPPGAVATPYVGDPYMAAPSAVPVAPPATVIPGP